MKRALVLSGGGAKGAFQAGVIESLQIKNIAFGFVSGVSVGALNAVMVAQNQIPEMVKMWQQIKSSKDVYTKRLLGFLSPLFGASSLYDPGPLSHIIRENVDSDRLKHSGIQLRIGMVNLVSGTYSVADQDHPKLPDCILASTAIPLAFPPVSLADGGDPMVDGGIRNIAPLAEAIEWGAEEIHVILCQDRNFVPEKKNYRHPMNIVLRSLDILMDEMVRSDIEICRRKNQQAERYRNVTLYVYSPGIPLCGTLEFSKTRINQAIDHGRQVAEEVFHEIA
ncbi:MAG TPA: patatin-like phospholipase family protein [Thermoanaerobaculia bacterium]|nr:patatin-like phospholipase family protein [Thermoanaerobaculia bacterium]HUM30791.1 patatin-like phospholipase family protein [Thermoanaerobaculia bacterium]HXK69009.1 patatin-like phospholipase family protein [Thermoanaerobaculia bacterium]